jgi:hypothetical protein
MTVSELIEKLKEFHPDCYIFIRSKKRYGSSSIIEIKRVRDKVVIEVE